jgi:predicted ATPase/transcriptional regulator with XRE-family HTH domain
MAEVTFGEWLKRRRRALSLTQAELAQQVGCSTIALRKIEAEERRPSEQIVERLAEVFNIVPAERQSFLRYARGNWRLVPTSLEEVPWRTARTSSHSNVPASTTSLIGRDGDIAAVRGYLAQADIRLVTLIGPPGIGKTRLSMAAARAAQEDFVDGAFFVPLATITDPDFVVAAMIQALGLVETDQRSALERLTDGLGTRQLLIVLDNFEQVIEAALLLADLLQACPNLKLIVTSRESLRVPGEWLYLVPPLTLPDEAQLKTLTDRTATDFSALRLFAERAHAVRPDFALTPETVRAVVAICRHLDGLPLAIELIASRLRMMSPQALLAHLTSDFTLQADGMRGVPARQKTLHNAIAWSYDLLSREEQTLLARLSVFASDFTLAEAQAIAQMPDAISGVMSLLDKSLLARAIDARGEVRFSQLKMIRDFARDRLREKNEEAEVRDRHMTYFLDLAEQADQEIHGPHQIDWLNRLELVHDNLRSALEWCIAEQNTEAGLRLLGSLGWPWDVRCHYSEARSWFDRLRALPEISAYPQLYARLLNHLGRHNWMVGDFHGARAVLEESRAIWLRLGVEGEQGLAEVLDRLGMVARWGEGDDEAAQPLFQQSFKLYQKCGYRRGLAESLFHLGIVEDDRNNDAVSLAWFEQSWALFQQLGDLWGRARVSQHLGQLFLKQGDFERARVFFNQHLMTDQELQFTEGTVVALRNLGNLCRHQSDYEQAEQFYEKSLLVCREHDLRDDMSKVWYGLSLLALQRNDYALAARYFTHYFSLAQKVYERKSSCDLLTGLAAVAAEADQPERAAKLHGAAQMLLETIDLPYTPFDRAEFDRHLQIAREQLGEERFEVLQAEGYTMTLDQAINLALKVTNERSGFRFP